MPTGSRLAKVCLSTCCVEQHPVPQAVQCSPRGHAELPVLVTNELVVGLLHSQEVDQSCRSAAVQTEPAAPILQCTDRLRPLKQHRDCKVLSAVEKHRNRTAPATSTIYSRHCCQQGLNGMPGLRQLQVLDEQPTRSSTCDCKLLPPLEYKGADTGQYAYAQCACSSNTGTRTYVMQCD